MYSIPYSRLTSSLFAQTYTYTHTHTHARAHTHARTHTFGCYKSDRRSLFSNDCHSRSREIARLTLVVCSLVSIINRSRKGRFVLLLNKRTKPCSPPLPRSACWWRLSSYCWSASKSKPPILRVKGNRSPTQQKSRT